jgi:hypothetical protein
MKTAIELLTYGDAQRFCDENGFGDFKHNHDPWKLADAILKLRREQDKITRHACSESIITACNVFNQGFFEAVSVDEAQAAIMNTKAI